MTDATMSVQEQLELAGELHRETIEGQDRIWFSTIRYTNKETGEMTRYPPGKRGTNTDGPSFTVEAGDNYLYGLLASSGLLYDRRHTGRDPTITRNENKHG